MSQERAVYLFAGIMVLVSVVLTMYVHPAFVWLTVFVGANLVQFSFTGICPAKMIFAKMGLKSEYELGQQSGM